MIHAFVQELRKLVPSSETQLLFELKEFEKKLDKPPVNIAYGFVEITAILNKNIPVIDAHWKQKVLDLYES